MENVQAHWFVNVKQMLIATWTGESLQCYCSNCVSHHTFHISNICTHEQCVDGDCRTAKPRPAGWVCVWRATSSRYSLSVYCVDSSATMARCAHWTMCVKASSVWVRWRVRRWRRPCRAAVTARVAWVTDGCSWLDWFLMIIVFVVI